MFPIKTLLHPTDFSEYAEEAHGVACALAREQNARLVILHVTDKPVVSYLEKASELNPQQVQDKLWETLQWPREMEAGLNIEHRIEEGDAVGQIVRVPMHRPIGLTPEQLVTATDLVAGLVLLARRDEFPR